MHIGMEKKCKNPRSHSRSFRKEEGSVESSAAQVRKDTQLNVVGWISQQGGPGRDHRHLFM